MISIYHKTYHNVFKVAIVCRGNIEWFINLHCWHFERDIEWGRSIGQRATQPFQSLQSLAESNSVAYCYTCIASIDRMRCEPGFRSKCVERVLFDFHPLTCVDVEPSLLVVHFILLVVGRQVVFDLEGGLVSCDLIIFRVCQHWSTVNQVVKQVSRLLTSGQFDQKVG